MPCNVRRGINQNIAVHVSMLHESSHRNATLYSLKIYFTAWPVSEKNTCVFIYI